MPVRKEKKSQGSEAKAAKTKTVQDKAKKQWGGHTWLAVAAILLTALLVWKSDVLLPIRPKPNIAPKAQRQVLRIWVSEEWTGSTAWLEKQGAEFERAHPGISLRIRRAQASELRMPDAVLPDMLLFAPGTLDAPDALLYPVYGDTPVRLELCSAARWQGTQWGVPVAMGGYAMLVNTEGYRDPAQSPLEPEAAAQAVRKARGKEPARYALQCAQAGALAYPTALLAQGGALRGGWPQGIAQGRGSGVLMDDFARCTQDKAYADFTSKRAMALLGTQRDIRKFSALVDAGKGFDFRVEVPQQAFTDQLLFVGVLSDAAKNQERLELCTQFLWHLIDDTAQQSLTNYGLFPVRADVAGYNAENTPWLHALAQVLAQEDIWVPNAFTWGQQREILQARTEAALTQEGVDLSAVPIQ